ncbi:GNAT family N-acetyltransferase [Nonomuraea aurantiaca]|uniref:GNAT family N-acetyltransferase n=1 Tax=Nonomuraea aurantiaca TaxID=2878562 RepID=UPI001CD9BECE|nr:GNAT family N-acetyltransferase [Nonomuraea aurantiaca]MCA2229058.1 GNAT family N-acetyltransferase [Nonomuraea aurantiaca]
MSVRWGSLDEDDAGSLAELGAAIGAADGVEERFSVEDVAEHLANPLLDLAEGTLVARDGQRLIAYGYLPVKQVRDGLHAMVLHGGVHPDFRGRGHGGRVLDWAIGTAPKLHERAYPGKGLELQTGIPQADTAAAALLEGKGFAAVRRFCQMRRDLSGELPQVRVPEGVDFVTYTPEFEEAARRVRNESFRDHWGSASHTAESWRHSITGRRGFRPESSFVARAGGEAVCVVLTRHVEGATAVRTAWIDIIGTLREWRGKGVAGNLIAHALAAFKEQGYARAGLSVDADNPTGAVGVYTRAGFEIYQRATMYSLPITPA